MEFDVFGKDKFKKKFLKSITPSLLKQLNIDRRNSCVSIILDPDLETSGATVKVPGVGYAVALKSSQKLKDLGFSLAHELVHVRQMVKGYLKTDKDESRIWCGKKYPKDAPYLQQPWEIDAFSRQEILLRVAINE